MHMYPQEKPMLPTPSPNNPSDAQRHEMLYNSLIQEGRAEDYDDIISLLSPKCSMMNYMPGEFKGIKVGIIGGGLSGMSAAFELRRLGYDITVFEPVTDRFGGRIYTYYFDKDRRLYGEFGAMRFPASHETTWHYINLFKLNTVPFINADPNTFTYVRNVRVRNDRKGQNILYNIYPLFDLSIEEANTPWPELYNQVARYYLSILPPEVRRQFLMILPGYDERFENITSMSIRQTLSVYGLSEEAINLIISVIPITGSIIESSYESTLNDHYTMDFLNLYRIAGGMVNLPLAFYKSLTSQNPAEYPDIPQNALGRINWKGGYHVFGIYKSDTNGKVLLKYGTTPEPIGTRDLYETFDYVICTLPMAFLREMDIDPLFSGKKMQAIRETFYQDAQKTLLLCKERFWEKQGIFAGSSYTDRVTEIISYPQDHRHCMEQNAYGCSPDEPGVLLASYNTGQDAIRFGTTTYKNRYWFVRHNVELVHGLADGYLSDKVIDYKSVDWYLQTWSKGAFQMFLPGQRRTFLYVSTIPEYDNRVFFAGEHTSVKNAWIQGALQSGISSANNVAYYSTIHRYQI